jgi:hypothetical protein
LWLIQWSPAFRPMLEPRPIKVLFHTFVCVCPISICTYISFISLPYSNLATNVLPLSRDDSPFN